MKRTVVRRILLPVTATAVPAPAARCGGDDMGGMNDGSGSDPKTTAAASGSSATFNDGGVRPARADRIDRP